MTILEVMISLGVIAFALSTLIGIQGGLQTSRVKASEKAYAQSLMRQLVDRLVASDASAIGDPAQMPWTVARYVDTVPGSHPPMSEGAADAADNLIGSALIDRKSQLKDLNIYLEYYAGCKGSDGGVPGILDDPDLVGVTDPHVWRTKFNEPAFRTTYRLDPAIPPSGQLEENDSFIIRVFMTWGDGQQLEVCTAKRVEPTE